MKRRSDELFYDYCARRLMDKEETKELLRPRFVWVSCILVPSPAPKFKTVPESERPLVKVRRQGTYRKPVKKEEADALR